MVDFSGITLPIVGLELRSSPYFTLNLRLYRCAILAASVMFGAYASHKGRIHSLLVGWLGLVFSSVTWCKVSYTQPSF